MLLETDNYFSTIELRQIDHQASIVNAQIENFFTIGTVLAI